MQKKILSLLMGDDLIRMPFIRRVGMLGVLFGLDIGIWSGSLSCFFDIRDWVLGQDVLCKRFRDNGKLIKSFVVDQIKLGLLWS